jgi:hypothetical protein
VTKPPWAGVRVVKAATEITSGQKLVWLEIYGLDRGSERAYVSAETLAGWLGMGARNIEKARRELEEIGLLGSAPRLGKRGTTWWPLLPPQCRPRSERPSGDEVVKLAALLDDLIRVAREANQWRTTVRPSLGSAKRTTVRLSGPSEWRTTVRLQGRGDRRGGSLPPREGWNNLSLLPSIL